MKTLLTLTILILTTFSCSNKQTNEGKKLPVTNTGQPTKKMFKQVAYFPTIKDTIQFIKDLRENFDLEVEESPIQKENEEITVFKKIKLYGSDDDFIFIEYDWKVGSMSGYPWKYQLLLTSDGKLVKILTGQRFEFVTIFPHENPFLLSVIATAKGNGGHQIFKITVDTLENVYEGYFDYKIQTYDAHQDLAIFDPNELRIKFKDENNDGFNDIIFNGQKWMLGKYTKDSIWYDVENGKSFSVKNPASKIPIRYVFFYDKPTGHFKAKENMRLMNDKEKTTTSNN